MAIFTGTSSISVRSGCKSGCTKFSSELINDKFNYTEEKLDFNVDALRYAGYSNFKSNNEGKIRKYLLENPKDVVPKFVRNRIKIFINQTYQLIIENVNSS